MGIENINSLKGVCRGIVLGSTFIGLLSTSGCMEYGINKFPKQMGLTNFQDCTDIVGTEYWFYDHEFAVIMLYGNCEPVVHDAYLLIEHEFELMKQNWAYVDYVAENGDVLTMTAVIFWTEFWYNPVDIEVSVVPFYEDVALGIHEFKIICEDDDDRECPVEYLGKVTIDDLD